MRWRRRTRAPMQSDSSSGQARRARSNSSRPARLRPRCRRSSRSSACSSIRSLPRCAPPSTRWRSTSCNSTATSRSRCAPRSHDPTSRRFRCGRRSICYNTLRVIAMRGPVVRRVRARRDAGRYRADLRLAGAGDAARRGLAQPLILSGGLTPHNVGAAIRALRPWAVDVSSGVETTGDAGRPHKGIKDPAKIAAFIRGVRDADG